MKISEISSILDRDYPMLLLDGVTMIEPNKKCFAFKNLTYNEWFFPQHFPKKPVMPGTIQIEAFSQAVALPLLMTNNTSQDSNIPILLAGIDKVRFFKPVFPGSRFEIHSEVKRLDLGIAISKVTGTIQNEIVSECIITYKMQSLK